MKIDSKKIFRNKFIYHLSKLAPYNFKFILKLKNGLRYFIRSRTMDRTIVKEVWIRSLYNQYGIKVEDGDTVLDIGAQIGVFSTYAATLNSSGNIYAFEPFVENYYLLYKNTILNTKSNIHIYNMAVSKDTQRKSLFLSPDNNTGGHSFHLKKESSNAISVESITLRKFCEEKKIDTIDFLKLDCEGSEYEILQSDENILDRVRKIIMECHPFEQNTVSDMIVLLEKKGFKVFRDENISLDECQMLYAKK